MPMLHAILISLKGKGKPRNRAGITGGIVHPFMNGFLIVKQP
jgi:hypothetical protein